jgi:hypothetical protein
LRLIRTFGGVVGFYCLQWFGDDVLLAKPVAQIEQFAPARAKRAVWACKPLALPSASRASEFGGSTLHAKK